MFLNPDLAVAVEKLGVTVAFTMSSEITVALLQQVTPFQTELSLDPRGFVLPIVSSIKDIASGKAVIAKEAYVVLCRQERIVLVWGDTVPGILAHGTDIETRLLGLVWGQALPTSGQMSPVMTPYRQSTTASTPAARSNRPSMYPISAHQSSTQLNAEMNEKITAIDRAIEAEEMGDKIFDPEKDGEEVPERPFLLSHAFVIGLAMILVVVVEMACIAKVSLAVLQLVDRPLIGCTVDY
jgi:hypothetical protein